MWVRNQRNSWHGVEFPYFTDRRLDDYIRHYYATLSAVDDSIGKILEYLRRNNLEKDTIIVFFSDNGTMFGEHGLIDKRAAYEPSVRVPLILHAPGLLPKGAVNPVRVRNLDLAPTFLAAAGLRAPPQFEGRSILALASGKEAPARWQDQDLIYEYYWEPTVPYTPTTFAIVHGNLKYIQYYGVWDTEELYDLSKDPEELNNVINEPEYLDAKIDLRARLYKGLVNHAGKHAIPFTERFTAGVVQRNKYGATVADFPPEWLVEPNLPSTLNGWLPDSKEKLEATLEGKALLR